MLIKHALRRLEKFEKDTSGAVAVEAGFYFVIFFLLCALLSDMSIVFLDKGKLERVNYSLAAITQQRERFHNENETLTESETTQLYAVAGALLANSRLAGRSYAIFTDAVYFADGEAKTVSNNLTFSTGDANCQVRRHKITDSKVTALAAWHADDRRWLPVYQVTICITGSQSLLMKISNVIGKTVGDLSVSNAVVPR